MVNSLYEKKCGSLLSEKKILQKMGYSYHSPVSSHDSVHLESTYSEIIRRYSSISIYSHQICDMRKSIDSQNE
jgi:hypothetical protein